MMMKFLRDETGATAGEYALVMTLVCSSLAVAAGAFSEAIALAFGNVSADFGAAG